MVKRGLGRGLGALLPDIDDNESRDIREINIIEIEPNKSQPRKNFDQDKLEALAASIKEHGIIQPIIVRKLESGFYQIIAGERRWRAAKIAGLKKIPVIIKDYEDRHAMEIALIENLQREDLNPIEEAKAYKDLLEEFNLTQEEISQRVGKSRSAIANSLRLLNLPEEIQQMLIENLLTMGHARALLSLESKELQLKAAHEIIDKMMSVRETEKYVKKLVENKEKKAENHNRNKHLLHVYVDIQNKLSQYLGTKVRIQPGKTKSKIEIEYYSDEDLERLLSLLQKQPD